MATKRTKRLTITLTPDERARLEARAEKAALRPSDFARGELVGCSTSKPPPCERTKARAATKARAKEASSAAAHAAELARVASRGGRGEKARATKAAKEAERAERAHQRALKKQAAVDAAAKKKAERAAAALAKREAAAAELAAKKKARELAKQKKADELADKRAARLGLITPRAAARIEKMVKSATARRYGASSPALKRRAGILEAAGSKLPFGEEAIHRASAKAPMFWTFDGRHLRLRDTRVDLHGVPGIRGEWPAPSLEVALRAALRAESVPAKAKGGAALNVSGIEGCGRTYDQFRSSADFATTAQAMAYRQGSKGRPSTKRVRASLGRQKREEYDRRMTECELAELDRVAGRKAPKAGPAELYRDDAPKACAHKRATPDHDPRRPGVTYSCKDCGAVFQLRNPNRDAPPKVAKSKKVYGVRGKSKPGNAPPSVHPNAKAVWLIYRTPAAARKHIRGRGTVRDQSLEALRMLGARPDHLGVPVTPEVHRAIQSEVDRLARLSAPVAAMVVNQPGGVGDERWDEVNRSKTRAALGWAYGDSETIKRLMRAASDSAASPPAARKPKKVYAIRGKKARNSRFFRTPITWSKSKVPDWNLLGAKDDVVKRVSVAARRSKNERVREYYLKRERAFVEAVRAAQEEGNLPHEGKTADRVYDTWRQLQDVARVHSNM